MARRRSNDDPFNAASLYGSSSESVHITPMRRAGPASADGHDTQYSSLSSRPPPSSFVFPFQNHVGNPDPGLSMPRAYSTPSRRSSTESVGNVANAPRSPQSAQHGHGFFLKPQSTEGHEDQDEQYLVKPSPPFARGQRSDSASSVGSTGSPRTSSTNSVYRNSAGAAAADPAGSATGLASTQPHALQARASTTSFRPAFQSPASRVSSRPGSQIWSPPAYPPLGTSDSPMASSIALGTYAYVFQARV